MLLTTNPCAGILIVCVKFVDRPDVVCYALGPHTVVAADLDWDDHKYEGSLSVAQYKHREGEKRTCPHCGRAATFSNMTRVPGTGVKAVTPAGKDPVTDYKAGWTCENKSCSQRYDFNM